MKMKKMIAFGLVTALTLSVAGCGNKSSTSNDSDGEYDQTETEEYVDETAYNSLGYAPTDEILNATLDDLVIQIGNTVYGLGSPITDLFNGNWVVKHSEYSDTNNADAKTVDSTLLVFPGESFSLFVSPVDDHSFEINLMVENTSDETVSLSECTIAEDLYIRIKGIDTEYYRENHDPCVWFPGGVDYRNTKDEVKEIYGEPYSKQIGNPDKPANSLTYRVNLDTGKYIEYTFSFPAEGNEESLFIESAYIKHN